MHYSYSKLKCFENCPQAFKYRYVAKVEVERFESIEAFMGHRVHETLEELYGGLKKGRIPCADELIDHFNTRWLRKFHDDIVVNKEDTVPEDYRLTGEKCVLDYYHRHHPFTGDKTLATEYRINADLLGDGQYKMLGVIDRLALCGAGHYTIHDYKTSRTLPTQEEMDLNPQLAIYELALRQKRPDVNEVDLVWHYLAHDSVIKSRRSADQLDELKLNLLKTIKEIERAVVDDYFPAKRTGLCNWCQYQTICSHFKNNITPRQMLICEYI